MPKGWVCTCGTRNTWVDKTCTNCQAEKPARKHQGGEPAETKTASQCAFTNFDRRCPLMASWFEEKSQRGFCTWHTIVVRDPRLNTAEEFIRFCTKLRGPDELEVLDVIVEDQRIPPRYCTVWAHYPPGVLWDWIESGGSAQLPAPRACFSPACPYASADVTEDQVETFRRAVRAGGWQKALDTLKGTARR